MSNLILNWNHMSLVIGNKKKMCTWKFDYVPKTEILLTGSLLYCFIFFSSLGVDIMTT